jgi:hypothetical protein
MASHFEMAPLLEHGPNHINKRCLHEAIASPQVRQWWICCRTTVPVAQPQPCDVQAFSNYFGYTGHQPHQKHRTFTNHSAFR